MNSDLNVLLVDDDQFTRTMLRTLLNGLEFASVIEAKSASEALEISSQNKIDIAILDLDLGEGPTGIDVAHALRRKNSQIAILMLSTYQQPRFMGQNQLPLPAGSVYLVKNSLSDPIILLNAIELALLSEDQPTRVISNLATNHFESLSDQQIEILRSIAAGYSNAEIAKRLWLSEAAVEKSIARLIKSLNIKAQRTQNQRVVLAQLYHQMTGAVSVRID